MAATHDTKGRPYAKLGDLKVGDKVETDDGFTCMRGRTHTVRVDSEGSLFIPCRHREHHLIGQADDGEHCVGVYPVAA